jgi:ABC-type antimicrobial peptide transport system permease subunit
MDHFWGTPTISFRSATFLVRTERAGTEGFVRELQRAVWDVNASLPLADVRTLGDVYRRSLARASFALAMLALSAGMGLLLGFIGLYAIVAFVVSQRKQEIGIRMALGAQSGELRRMFVRQGLVLTGAGIAAGVAAALALTRLMASLLFGVSPLDPATYGAVIATLVVVATLAAYLPARGATRGNPLAALRNN